MFYTSVSRYRNSIEARGYDGYGSPFFKTEGFSPTLCVPSEKGTWKSLDDRSLSEIRFSKMSEATRFKKDHEGLEIHGDIQPVYQYISEMMSDDHFIPNTTLINVSTIDIEVADGEGFPDIVLCDRPVTAITIHYTSDDAYLTYSTVEFSTTRRNSFYVRCKDEVELLESFIHDFRDIVPDVITGWNSRLFDMPYLIGRIINVLGQKAASRLSPFGRIEQGELYIKGKPFVTMDIVGVQQLDYMDLFKKFGVWSYGEQESYRLTVVADTVLGIGKIEYEQRSLDQLMREDPKKFIDYNVRDVELVVRMNRKDRLIELIMAIAYKAGVNYGDCLGTTKIWDTMIYNALKPRKIAIPPSEDHMRTAYEGAFVKEPVPGMYEWVTSFDVASMYPSLIMQYNMSPETLISGKLNGVSVESLLNETIDDTGDMPLAANGARFRTDRKGILPELVRKLFDERTLVKKEMLRLKSEKELINARITELEKKDV